MKKNILLCGVLFTLSALAVQAFPDGMPNFTPGSINPAMSPATFGAYEMQMMKEQRQRQYIDEDFKLYQKKKELEKTGEVDSDIIKDDRVDLESESEANNTFIKRVRNRSKSNPDYVQNNGKVIVKEEPKSEAKEIKVRDNSNPAVQQELPAVESGDKPESVVPEENTQTQPQTKPQIKEDSLSSSSTYKPLVKQAKAKPWLDEISPDVPTVEPASFEDNFDAD